MTTIEAEKTVNLILKLGSELIDKNNTPYQWSEDLRSEYEHVLGILESYQD